MNKQDLITTSLVSLAVVVLLLLGFFGGRYFTLSRFEREIRVLEKAYTLGPLLSDQKKQSAIQAFHPDSQDIRALDDYSWSPPSLPTPFVGGAPAPGRQGNAQINRLQFRSPHEVAVPKPAGVVRVFLTGGSTAYSSGAPSDDRTIAGYLEKDLNAGLAPGTGKTFEVLTMANPAWASTHERIAIENLLSELQPDLVISLSGNNDVHWAENGHNILWFRTYFDQNVFSLIQRIYSMSRNIDLEDNLAPSRQPVDPRTVAERLLKNVDLSTFILARSRTPYLFVLQPTLAAISKPLTARETSLLQKSLAKNPDHQHYFRSCYQAMDSALASATGGTMHYLNLSSVFDRSANDEIFIDSYHFGDKGNELIAHAIAAKAFQIIAPSLSKSPVSEP